MQILTIKHSEQVSSLHTFLAACSVYSYELFIVVTPWDAFCELYQEEN